MGRIYGPTHDDTHEALADARDMLTDYRQYAEEMRAIGRGYHPTVRRGTTADALIGILDRLIMAHDLRTHADGAPFVTGPDPRD